MHSDIPGWMNGCELAWLGERASEHKIIVEIGSWMGRSTRVLAENTLGTVYAVDTWKGSAEHQEILAGKDENWLFSEFTRYTCDVPNIIPLRMTAGEALEWMREKRIVPDMVFIDAAHDYESVSNDISYWSTILAPEGLLCGHDYGSWEGVTKAVDELLPGASLAKTEAGFYIWAAENKKVAA